MISLHVSDALDFLIAQPPASVDLVIGSPPYALKGGRYRNLPADAFVPQTVPEWVRWMATVVEQCCRISRGMVFFVVDSPRVQGEYNPAVEGLLWTIATDKQVVIRTPHVWHKNGAPGGTKWPGHDWELVLGFHRRGVEPFYDPVRIGHAAKYDSGPGRQRKANGERSRAKQGVKKGALSRPRDVVSTVEKLTLEVLFAEVCAYGVTSKSSPYELLSSLRQATSQKKEAVWLDGILAGLRAATVLRPELYGAWREVADSKNMPALQSEFPAKESSEKILYSEMLLAGKSEIPRTHDSNRSKSSNSEEFNHHGSLRNLQDKERLDHTPQGRESSEQRCEKSSATLQKMPRPSPQSEHACFAEMFGVWSAASEEIFEVRNALRRALPQMEKAWDRYRSESENGSGLGAGGRSDFVRATVGGGHMGRVKPDGVIDAADDKLATSGEAPYPVRLADYFLRGWCPPGGKVCDPFTGTGTTAVAAHELGMDFVGCDLRACQIEVAKARLKRLEKASS